MLDAGLVHFGKRVRTLRERIGLSQEQLAEQAGIHRTYVGGVERGERNIGLKNVFRIAKALEITVADLFADEIDHTR